MQVIPAKDQQFYGLLHNNSQLFSSLLAMGTWERINSSKLLVRPSSWSDFASSSFMRPGFVSFSNSSTLPTKCIHIVSAPLTTPALYIKGWELFRLRSSPLYDLRIVQNNILFCYHVYVSIISRLSFRFWLDRILLSSRNTRHVCSCHSAIEWKL